MYLISQSNYSWMFIACLFIVDEREINKNNIFTAEPKEEKIKDTPENKKSKKWKTQNATPSEQFKI